MTGAEGPIAAFIIIMAGIAIWKAGSWAWGKVSKPTGYAIVAVTAAGILVLPLAGTTQQEQVEALRDLRTSLAEHDLELRVSEDREITDPSTSLHGARVRGHSLEAVTSALESEDYVVSVVDADTLRAALESPNPVDELSLFPETRSVWESDTPSWGLTSMVGVVPHEQFESQFRRHPPAETPAAGGSPQADTATGSQQSGSIVVDGALGEEPTTR